MVKFVWFTTNGKYVLIFFFHLVYKKPGLTPGRGQNIATCNYATPPGKGKVCDVDVKAFDMCTEEHRFYFDRQAPCIFLKLNKVRNLFIKKFTHLVEIMFIYKYCSFICMIFILF